MYNAYIVLNYVLNAAYLALFFLKMAAKIFTPGQHTIELLATCHVQ